MSVLNGDKQGFVDFFKNLFARRSQAEQAIEESESTAATRSSTPAVSHPANPNMLTISLQSVIDTLPLELQGRVKTSQVGNARLNVPLDRILSQLAQGSVKVPFEMVRKAAPAAFSATAESDQVMVTLPLNEILPKINPALLTRRPAQRQVEVSPEVSSPFDAPEQAMFFAVGNPAGEAPGATSRAPLPPRNSSPNPTAVPFPSEMDEPDPFRFNIPQKPAAAVTQPKAAASQARASVPFKPQLPAAATPEPRAVTTQAKATVPFKPQSPAPKPVVQKPETPRPQSTAAERKPVKNVLPPATAPVAAPAELTTISVTLTSLAETWPDNVRHEIVRLKLLDARIALPAELVETSLKRGRVAFPWRTLRSWIRPNCPQASSPHDEVELELPLKVIAPLFIGRRNTEILKKAPEDIDEAIPNLFFGFAKPDAAVAVPSKKMPDTNYYVFGDTLDSVQIDETQVKRRTSLEGGTAFVTRYATPNEIVSRAAALDGVAGVLVALPDGLMVASRIPAELNGDTLAAFLPQIFSKVSQTTKELRMGELNNLSFTVGNVPWKIFRVNAIYFAAFGRESQPLPTAQLAALASELDRKNK